MGVSYGNKSVKIFTKTKRRTMETYTIGSTINRKQGRYREKLGE